MARNAGVEVADVDAAKLPLDLLDDLGPRFLVTDVGGNVEVASVAGRRLHIDDRGALSLRAQHLDRGKPDAGRAPGYEGIPVLQRAHTSSFRNADQPG